MQFRFFQKLIWGTAGFLVFIGIWSALAWIFPSGPTRVVDPISTFFNLLLLLREESFITDIVLSVKRVLIGFSVAAGLGSMLGWLGGISFRFNQILLPYGSFLRYIPPLALLPLLIVYLGIGEVFKSAVVFFGIFFFILQMSIDSVQRIDPHYWDLAVVQRLNRFEMLKKLVVPSTLSECIDTWRINLAAAWTFVVAAEIVGSQGGIGYFIFRARRFGQVEDVYAAILLFGFIGLTSDLFLLLLRNAISRWKR